MLAIRDGKGMIAGFIGRAHPEAGPAVPKYLNSKETSAYTKDDLLFGLLTDRLKGKTLRLQRSRSLLLGLATK